MPEFSGPEICKKSACEVVDLLRKREISPSELVEATLTRIEQVSPSVNATVTVCADRARKAAKEWDGGDPDQPGWLGGMPIGVKILNPVSGVRTTWGTKGLSDFVPKESDPLVARMESLGGIVVGMTNSPEMGAGGNTFNDVHGRTRNAWDTSKNAGGSSGGTSVSLAVGETWLSHGSDHAGSLRTPASLNGIVGLRPSPGRCGGPASPGFSMEGLSGPMARSVEDVALFLDTMSGYDAVWPISFPAPRIPFLTTTRAGGGIPRIAFAPTLGGYGHCTAEIQELLSAALQTAEGHGAIVEENCPDLGDLGQTYRIIRGVGYAGGPGSLPEKVQNHYKPTIKENIAYGRNLSVDQIEWAAHKRTSIYHSVRNFLKNFDVIACPVIGCRAGPNEEEYPPSVDGHPTTDYIDWLRFTFLSTTTGLPAMSVPVGKTPDGIPVGIQLIGPPRGEARLLQVAKFIENAVGWDPKPIDPIVTHE